jgi:hypothetical protein
MEGLITKLVLYHLSPINLLRVSEVNKAWNALARSDDPWWRHKAEFLRTHAGCAELFTSAQTGKRAKIPIWSVFANVICNPNEFCRIFCLSKNTLIASHNEDYSIVTFKDGMDFICTDRLVSIGMTEIRDGVRLSMVVDATDMYQIAKVNLRNSLL